MRDFGGLSGPPAPRARRSRLGGRDTGSSRRGRPSGRLGGTCLHWSGLVSPGGGGRLAAAWGRVLRAPGLGRRGDRVGSVPRPSPGGAAGLRGTPVRGDGEGDVGAAGKRWQGWGALVSPGAGEGSGRAGVSQREREAAVGPADVRGPRGAAWGSPGHTWVQGWGCERAQWEQDPAGTPSHTLVNGAWRWCWGPCVKCAPSSASESGSRAGVAQQPWRTSCRGQRWPELGWDQAVRMGLPAWH